MNENMIADLIAARKKMPTLSKDSKNEHFRNKYVSLETLIEAVVPILNEHNLTVAQFPTTLDGQPALKTSILHTSGGELTDTMLILAVKDDPQGQGSGITYARRYALMSMLGIAGESDDDGEASRRSFDRAPTRQAAPAAQRVVAQQRNGTTQAPAAANYGAFWAKTREIRVAQGDVHKAAAAKGTSVPMMNQGELDQLLKELEASVGIAQ